MNEQQAMRRQATQHRTRLATDLDGTLIPLSDGHQQQNQTDLSKLKNWIEEQKIPLYFVTSRHYASVAQAIDEFQLPRAEWIIADVGTSIYSQDKLGGNYGLLDAYSKHLAELVKQHDRQQVELALEGIAGIELQPQKQQGNYKISYFCEAEKLSDFKATMSQQLLEAGMPYEVLMSVDPFTHQGLLDVLPSSVSKAYALNWLGKWIGYEASELIYAGDSGNDLAALVAPYRSLVVGNALAELVDLVQQAKQESAALEQFYHAKAHATSGVWEGVLHYEALTQNTQ